MCGKAGQACCDITGMDDCGDGLSCIGSMCTACGAMGEACCPEAAAGPRCTGNGVGCIANKCSQCGDPGEPCCPVNGGAGDGCSGTCVSGMCTAG